MVTILILLSLMSAPQASPSAPEFLVLLRNSDEYRCSSEERVPNQAIKAGAVVRLIEETGSLLRVIDLESGRVLCIRAKKNDLPPVQAQRARDGTLAPFPGIHNGTIAPSVVSRGRPLPSENQDLERIENLTQENAAFFLVVVEKEGSISACTMIRSSGNPEWDRLAERMVCMTMYKAAKLVGRPVAVTLLERIAPERAVRY